MTSKYFAYPSNEEIENEKKKLKPEFLEEIKSVGQRIIKLTEIQDLENLEALCKEAVPILPFLRDQVAEAFIGALYIKDEETLTFFLDNGLELQAPPLDESITTLIKVSKYSAHDPPTEILNLLIKHKAKIDYIDPEKFRTPIFYACKTGNLEFIKILAENGAEINPVDKKSKLPLNYVDDKLKMEPKNPRFLEIKNYLVSKGAQTSWKNPSMT